MTESLDAADLTEALDYIAITRLQARYGDIITRRAWDELEPLFAPDAPITLDLRRGEPTELVGATALGTMVARAVERFEFFEFALLNSVVDGIDAEAGEDRTATGRLYMWELRQEASNGRWSNAFGLYRDTYVRHEGRWVIGDRRYSSLARTGPDAEVFTVPPLD